MVRIFLAAAALAALTACAAPQQETTTQAQNLAADGRDIAEAQCAGCHAVGANGDSPNPTSPPFRTVLSRYRADVLRDELIAGIQVTHPMPNFQFNPQGADALIAYLQSIQAPTAGQ